MIDQKVAAPEKVVEEKKDHQGGDQDQDLEVKIIISGRIITIALRHLSIEGIPGQDLDQEKRENLIDTDHTHERTGDLIEKDLFQEIESNITQNTLLLATLSAEMSEKVFHLEDMTEVAHAIPYQSV